MNNALVPLSTLTRNRDHITARVTAVSAAAQKALICGHLERATIDCDQRGAVKFHPPCALSPV